MFHKKSQISVSRGAVRRILVPALLSAMACVVLSSCSRTEINADPGAWGYSCSVTYDALGGIINQREVRTTFYIENSYLYRPAGSTGFLIQPIKDGYTLAGWYTAKEDITDGSGNVIDYIFRAEDRWDFDEDRVQGDMTLYARWIPTAALFYYSAETVNGEHPLLFNKNITEESGVQPLSYAVETSNTPFGYTLYGYYTDPECTELYDFSVYENVPLVPDNLELYSILAVEFPSFFEMLDAPIPIPVVKPPGENDWDSDEEDESVNPYAFIEAAGYRLLTDETEDLALIRNRKDEIVHSFIQRYSDVNANLNIYLKFIEGRYIRVTGLDTLLRNGRYYLDGTDNSGSADGYILTADLDFTGITLEYAESFSGTIFGNGHKISNLEILVDSRKGAIEDFNFYGGLFGQLNGAVIEDVVFENILVAVHENSGNSITLGLLAGSAVNTTVRNCTFDGALIRTGASEYRAIEIETRRTDAAPRLIRIGDLFGEGSGNTVSDNVYIDCQRRFSGTVLDTGNLF